jgi:hypothetical protein
VGYDRDRCRQAVLIVPHSLHSSHQISRSDLYLISSLFVYCAAARMCGNKSAPLRGREQQQDRSQIRGAAPTQLALRRLPLHARVGRSETNGPGPALSVWWHLVHRRHTPATGTIEGLRGKHEPPQGLRAIRATMWPSVHEQVARGGGNRPPW